MAKPFSLPFKLGMTKPIALAAPVLEGIIDSPGRSCSAQVRVGGVEQTLIQCIAVNCCHQSAFDAESVVDHFSYWSQAVSGAAGVGNDVVFFRVVGLVVDTDNDSDVFVLRWSGNQDFLGTGGDVTFCFSSIGEDATAFQNDVYVQSFPRASRWVTFCKEGNLFAVSSERFHRHG